MPSPSDEVNGLMSTAQAIARALAHVEVLERSIDALRAELEAAIAEGNAGDGSGDGA